MTERLSTMHAEHPISCDILEPAQMFKETVEFAVSPTPRN